MPKFRYAANKIHKTFAVVTCASFNPTGQPTSKIAARNKYIQDIIIVRLFYYLNTALSNPLYNQGSYDNIDNNFIIRGGIWKNLFRDIRGVQKRRKCLKKLKLF